MPKYKCLFCPAEIEGQADSMRGGHGRRARSQPEFYWYSNGAQTWIPEYRQVHFVLCPQHQQPDDLYRAFEWAQKELEAAHA